MLSPVAVIQFAMERVVHFALGEVAEWGAPAGSEAIHPRGHAHNDEMQAHPLVDALQAGMGSIEADVHLIDGDLLVGHDGAWARSHRLRLEDSYIAPLVARVQRYGGVYRRGVPTVLLLDFKDDPTAIYAVLVPLLEKYRSALSSYQDGKKTQRPIDVVITGAKPAHVVDLPGLRRVAFDGSVAELLRDPSAVSPERTPMLNGWFKAYFKWTGTGPMAESEDRTLRHMVDLAHQRHVRLRLWDAPDNPAAWSLLETVGVDYVNTDHLQDFAQWQDRFGHVELPTP